MLRLVLGTLGGAVIRFAGLLPLTECERTAVLRVPAVSKRFRRGETIYSSDDGGGIARILASGLAIQYRILPDGERQSADLVFPGRFCDLGCVLFGKPDHFLGGVTDGAVIEVSTSDVLDLFSRCPRIPILLLYLEARDRSIIFEHLLSVGRRPAIQRLAHLLTEISVRSALAGTPPSRARKVSLGLQWYADLLGLTPVHVSRTFAKLREMGLVEHRGTRCVIRDPLNLARLGEFDPDYLHLDEFDRDASEPSMLKLLFGRPDEAIPVAPPRSVARKF